MKKIVMLLGLVVFIVSCEEQITDKYTHYKVEGVDRHGQNRVCFNDPDRVCTEIADIAEEDFAQSCKDAGHRVHPCGCHEYVCEQKTFTGIDINGEEKSCKELAPNVACTMEFTEGDQYALDCKNDGAIAIQCGCHDFICVEDSGLTDGMLDGDPGAWQPDPVSEYYGTNQDGVVTQCAPEKDFVCPTVINHVQIYALNCKEEGHDVAWCNCNEVLCLDQ